MGLFGLIFGKKKQKKESIQNGSQEKYFKEEVPVTPKINSKQNSDDSMSRTGENTIIEPMVSKKYSTKVMPKSKESAAPRMFKATNSPKSQSTNTAPKSPKTPPKASVNDEKNNTTVAAETVTEAPNTSSAKAVSSKAESSVNTATKTETANMSKSTTVTKTKTSKKAVVNMQSDEKKEEKASKVEIPDEEIANTATLAADNISVTEGTPTRNGKFDIMKAKDGRYFFNLYASNYVVIAYSQLYSTTQSAMTGIKSIINNATKAGIEDNTLKNPVAMPFPKWEIYIDKAGEYRFRLYASNGNCICHSSHGYSSKYSCKGGIDSISRFASESAGIDKKYLNK